MLAGGRAAEERIRGDLLDVTPGGGNDWERIEALWAGYLYSGAIRGHNQSQKVSQTALARLTNQQKAFINQITEQVLTAVTHAFQLIPSEKWAASVDELLALPIDQATLYSQDARNFFDRHFGDIDQKKIVSILNEEAVKPLRAMLQHGRVSSLQSLPPALNTNSDADSDNEALLASARDLMELNSEGDESRG
jgi:hypothetical protein